MRRLSDMIGNLASWLQHQWYEESTPSRLLMPLSALFQQAVKFRRTVYRLGLVRSKRLPVPVIVVGNISVGGTGKTPLVIWLAEFLRQAGYCPGVISRGYGGRKLSEPRAVGAECDPAEVGDEPLLIARRTRCPVSICPDRVAAGRALIQRGDCDIVISDDGLQHYALARDIEIAVIDGDRRCGNGRCLPAGPLREAVERLDEVDLVVCQGQPQMGEFGMALSGEYAVNLSDETLRRPLASFAGRHCRAIAGIGNPGRFFAYLRHRGLEVKGQAFPDHYVYQRDDIRFGDELPVLMTEKDAVKCRRFAGKHDWYVPVAAILPPAFGDNLLALLRRKCDG